MLETTERSQHLVLVEALPGRGSLPDTRSVGSAPFECAKILRVWISETFANRLIASPCLEDLPLPDFEPYAVLRRSAACHAEDVT